jgi:hypothetical protein
LVLRALDIIVEAIQRPVDPSPIRAAPKAEAQWAVDEFLDQHRQESPVDTPEGI